MLEDNLQNIDEPVEVKPKLLFFLFLSAQSQSGKAKESFEWKVNWVRQWFLINILYPVLPLPPLFLLLPFFPLFQINRVALIQCVSCRLPWRLFDPVFQSLPLGQTCFSSVCCTPALEAAAVLRQTMGCCARLTPPFSSCRSHFLSVFWVLSISLFLLVFSLIYSPSLCLSLTRSASLWSRQSSPPSAWASRIPKGRGEARTSAKQPSLEEKKERETLLLTLSFCLYSWRYSLDKAAASPLLPHWTFTCSTCLIAGVWLQCS